MDPLQLLYKYMAHLQFMEDSTFVELVNTPFSNVTFTPEELETSRQMENSLIAGKMFFVPARS